MTEDDREEPVTVPFVTPQARLTSLLFRTGLRFDSSWDSTVWKTWGTSDDGIFYLFITDYIFKIENIYLCVEQKRFGGHGVHWSSILMFPLGVGIPRFAHKPCGRQLSACGLCATPRESWLGRHKRGVLSVEPTLLLFNKSNTYTARILFQVPHCI